MVEQTSYTRFVGGPTPPGPTMIYEDKHHPEDIEAVMIVSLTETLNKACVLAGVEQSKVKSVTELGGGVGRNTRAILQVFPQATVRVISFTDQRDPDLKANKRIKFFEGEFVRVLKSGQVGPADVVVLQDAGDGHGFNPGNINLLAKAVGHGILITGGHNGSLFDDSFYDHFLPVATVEEVGLFGTFAWRVK